MKILKDLCQNFLEKDFVVQVVHFQAIMGTWKSLDVPVMSNEISCSVCGNRGHTTIHVLPGKDSRRIWMCGNSDCPTMEKDNFYETKKNIQYLFNPFAKKIDPTKKERCLEWKDFCDKHEIGNIHHEISFDKIEQSVPMKTFLLKYAQKPSGIVIMQGKPGTGKTYGSLGVCEYFTRSQSSCVFVSQRELLRIWLSITRGEIQSNYLSSVENCLLLVIDDFGTSEPSPGFMSYFMELIDKRMQWKDKGTIITTNLDTKKLNVYCGDALNDRLGTGQFLIYEGKTRRKPIIT